MLKISRKRRSDRNQVLYYVEHVPTGAVYIGLTALCFKGNVNKTLNRRMQKHVQRAYTENKSWGLSKALRKYNVESFVCGPIEVVRGKKAAHLRETELINLLQPSLNTFGIKQ